MDLVAFHYDRSFVLDALRQGEIDYLEHVSEAAEADLAIAGGKGFGYLFARGKKLRKVAAEKLVDELLKELTKLSVDNK